MQPTSSVGDGTHLACHEGILKLSQGVIADIAPCLTNSQALIICIMPLGEPFQPHTAAWLIRKIVASGTIQWSSHARKRLVERRLNEDVCEDVLRVGGVANPRLEGGTWRYRVHHGGTTVVVALRDEETLTIVTVWRLED